MSEKKVPSLDAIYDALAERYKNGDRNVRKTEDGHYQLLNDKGEVILESYRF